MSQREFVLFEVPLLRLGHCWLRPTAMRKLGALPDRYRDMAKTFGFEGHIALAEAMP